MTDDLVGGKPRPPETHPLSECMDPAICPQHAESDASWYKCAFCGDPAPQNGPGISITCEKPECREKGSAAFKSLSERTGPICCGCAQDWEPGHRCPE